MKSTNRAPQNVDSRDSGEELDSSSAQIPDSGASDSNGSQTFTNSDITMATAPSPLGDNIQDLLEQAPDKPPTLALPTLACVDDLDSSETSNDTAPGSWTDMLGEFSYDSKLLATTNFAQEDDIYASEHAEFDSASTLPTDEHIQTSSIFGHQDEQRAPINASGGPGYGEPVMSGARHPDDVIDQNDLAMDDCVHSIREAPQDTPLTATERDGLASSSHVQHHEGVDTSGDPKLLQNNTPPSINTTNDDPVPHNATSTGHDNGLFDHLMEGALAGRLSNSFMEQLIELVNLSQAANGSRGPS